jgi:outer membrane protein assembly factor BamB
MKARLGYRTTTTSRITAAAVGSFLSIMAVSLKAADWPCYRGPNHDGHSTESITVWPPQEAWRTQIGAGFSGVVVSNGRVYAIGNANGQDTLFCFDESSTGTNPVQKWSASYTEAADPMGSGNPGPRATPTVDGNQVYTFSIDGKLKCFDTATGTPIWSASISTGMQIPYGYASSPLVQGNNVIVNAGNTGTAFDKSTGHTNWSSTGDAGFAAAVPVTIGSQPTVVIYADGQVSGVDPATGNVFWYIDTRSGIPHSDVGVQDPIVYNNQIYISKEEGHSGAFVMNLGSGKLTSPAVWETFIDADGINCGIFVSGKIYTMGGVTGVGRLICTDFATGTKVWSSADSNITYSMTSTEWPRAGMILANDQLVVLDNTMNNGCNLVVVPATPSGYSEIHRATNILGTGNDTGATAPTLANGKLYVRTQAGTLVAYKVGTPTAATGIVQFASSAYSVTENSGSAMVQVSLVNGASGTVTVDFATGGGTAVAGVNYAATNGTLSFAYGETSKTFTVSVMDDGIWEPGNLTVNLGLSHITGSAVLGSSTNAVLTILDADGPGCFQFTSSGYTAAQDGGSANIQVTRINGKTGAASVHYATSDGTAASGLNYTPASGTLNFANGETSKTFSVTILNQPVGGSGKTVNLTLSSPTGGATIGTPGSAVLTIVPPGSFSTWSYNMKIQFPGYTQAGALTNFPVSLVFSNNMGGGFNYSQLVSPSGGDLRFADGTKTNALNFEIEKWSTNAVSYVWVQVPVLSNGCSIWAYWGNSATTPPACTTNGATWAADFRGVWHLGEPNGTTNSFDSTANRNDAYNNLESGPGTCKVGTNGVVDGAAGYDGHAYDSINNMNNTLSITGQVTVSIWVYPNVSFSGQKVGFVGDVGQTDGGDYGLCYSDFGASGVQFLLNGNHGCGTIPLLTWTYLVGTYDGSYWRAYSNGIQVASGAQTGAIGTSWKNHGQIAYYCGGKFNGNLDEARVMAVAVSSNWIWTSYLNTASNSAFCSYGSGASGNASMGTPISWLEKYGFTSNFDAAELNDPDGDGVLVWQNYIMGNDPTSSSGVLKAGIQRTGNETVISFPTISASGSDYTGKTRCYDLETATNLLGGAWLPVVNETNIIGANLTVTYTNAVSDRTRYYRVGVKLM